MARQHFDTWPESSPIVWDRYPNDRGAICVLRYSWGELEVLRISPQSSYAEWPGCFCIL